MPRKHQRTRVERGLYREGKVYWACATPPGSRQAIWQRLGPIGLMEARRLRDEFVVRTRHEPEPTGAARKSTFGDVAAVWLDEQTQRVAVAELRPATFDIYESGLRLHWTLLRLVLSTAVRQGLIASNPAERLLAHE
jgi:hypothetical protein